MRSPVEMAALDSPLLPVVSETICKVGDDLVFKVNLTRGVSYRDALVEVHHSAALFFKQIFRIGQEGLVDQKRTESSKEYFLRACADWKPDAETHNSCELDDPVKPKINAELVRRKAEEIFATSVTTARKAEAKKAEAKKKEEEAKAEKEKKLLELNPRPKLVAMIRNVARGAQGSSEEAQTAQAAAEDKAAAEFIDLVTQEAKATPDSPGKSEKAGRKSGGKTSGTQKPDGKSPGRKKQKKGKGKGDVKASGKGNGKAPQAGAESPPPTQPKGGGKGKGQGSGKPSSQGDQGKSGWNARTALKGWTHRQTNYWEYPREKDRGRWWRGAQSARWPRRFGGGSGSSR